MTPNPEPHAPVRRVDGWSSWILVGLAVAAGLVIYGRTATHPLIGDSEILVTSTTVITADDPLSGFREPFFLSAADQGEEGLETVAYWRPVLATTLNLWLKAFGTDPVAWHVLALLLNVIITALVYGLARSIGWSRGISFWVAMFFAVNPGRVSMVAWVYSLTNQFFVALALGASCAWIRGRFGMAVALTGLALGTRETAVLLPVVFLAWDGLMRRRSWPVPWLLTMASGVVIYLVLRASVLGAGPPVGSMAPLDWLSAVVVITARHVASLIWPAWGVRFYPLSGAWDDPGLVVGAAIVSLILLAVWAWSVLRHRWFGFWLTWCGVWLAINFNVGEFGRFLMGEKNNGLLAVGLAFLVVGAGVELSRRVSMKRLETLALLGILAHGSLAAWRVGHWASPEAYYRSAIANAPEFGHLHYALGMHYVATDQIEAAETAFGDAARFWPELSTAWNNLGTARFLQGNFQGASQAWREALVRDPTNARAAFNLALLYDRLGDPDEAARYRELHRRLTTEPN